MTAREDVITTAEGLEALIRQYAEAGAPAVVQERGFRLWLLTEDERGDHWAWSWREDDDSERESEEGGTVVPVETLNLPLTVLHVPGEHAAHDVIEKAARAVAAHMWDRDTAEAPTWGALTPSEQDAVIENEQTAGIARALADAGLLARPLPTRDEIAWQIALAMDRTWSDETEYADLPTDAADAVRSLLEGGKR